MKILVVFAGLLVAVAYGDGEVSVADQINSLAEQKSDIKFALAPNMSQWEYLLLPTPTVVKLLGQMVVISSKVDVSLTGQKPEKGWKFVANPSSLRASLLQVGNQGWSAFQVAHANMDHISLTMAVVPRHVRTALKILALPTVPMNAVTRLLQSPLRAIERAGDSCVAWAAETSNAFLDVMGLTAELSVAVGGQQGDTDRSIVEATAQLEAAKTQKELMDKQKKFMMERYEEQKKVVEEARAKYEKAIKKIPTGFKAFAMDFLMTVGPSIVGAMAGVPVMPMPQGGGGGSGGGGFSGGALANSSQGAQDIHDPIILRTMQVVADKMPEMKENVEAALDEAAEVSVDQLRDYFLAAKTMLGETLERFTSYPNTAVKALGSKALQGLVKIAGGFEKRLEEAAEELSEEGKAAVMEKLAEAQEAVQSMLAAGIQTGDAGGHRLPSSSGGGGGGSRSRVGANERFIAASRLQNLGNAEASLDAIFRDINTFNQQLTEVEVRMSRIRLERVNLEQVRELLRQVLDILGKLRELWTRLVQFFTLVATRAKVINANYLLVFREMSETTGDLIAAGGRGASGDLVKLLKEQALDINTVSYLLHTMAKTYVRVSGTHVLGKLAGLAKLLAAKDDAERDRWFAKLNTDAEASRAEIMALIRRQQASYQSELLAKRQRLRAALDAMGGETSTDRSAIATGAVLADQVRQGDIVGAAPDDPWDMEDLV